MDFSPKIRLGALAGPVDELLREHPAHRQLSLTKSLCQSIHTNPEALIDVETYLAETRRIDRTAGDPTFFLRSASYLRLNEIGMFGQGVLCAPTIADALSVIQEGFKYFQSNASVEIGFQNGKTQLEYSHGLGSDAAANADIQYTIGAIAKIVGMAQHRSEVDTVMYLPGAGIPARGSALGVVRSHSGGAGIVEFDRTALASPMPYSNSDRAAVLSRFFTAHPIDEMTELTLANQTAALIEASVGIVRPTAGELAAILGMHLRTLQAGLRMEQTTFQEILTERHKAVSLNALSAGESVTDVSLKLGYDHPQNFTTAFQRWFGHSPTTGRRRRV